VGFQPAQDMNMRSPLLIRTILLLAALATAGTDTIAQESDAELIAKVKAVWRKREEATKSFRMEISDTHIRGKNTILLDGSLTKDLEINESQVLAVDDVKVRHQTNGADWCDKINATAPKTVTVVRTAEEFRLLQRFDAGDGEVDAFGIIEPSKPVLVNSYLLPIMEHFRPSSSGMNLDHLEVMKRDVKIDDDTCILLEDSDALGDKITWTKVRRLYYVSLEKEMAIRRYEQYVGVDLHFEMDTDYRRDKKYGWMPEKISGIRHIKKKFFDSCTLVVSKAELNIPIPAETFVLDFPDGMKVTDHRARKPNP
jgi:hypothetical protein